jgi:hypothetical protein
MKSVVQFIIGLLSIVFISVFIGGQLGVTPFVPFAVLFTASTVYAFIPKTENVFYLTVYKEIWTGELIEKFRSTYKWMGELTRADSYVDNDIIHLVKLGADPNVLINNVTYPIASAGLTDTDLPISLDKFDTENTYITDDELYAISYDKMASVIKRHNLALTEKTALYGLYKFAPVADSLNTPLIQTTGPDRGDGFKRLIPADIIRYRTALDNLLVPKAGRVIVLSSDHVNDLLTADQSFRDRYNNTVSGEVINFFGFNFYEEAVTNKYVAAGTKKAFGAAPVAGDRKASTGFFAPRSIEAIGTVKMYYAKAELDPKNRRTEVGFQMRHLAMPLDSKGTGAIIDTPSV